MVDPFNSRCLSFKNEEFNVKHNKFLNDPLMKKLYNERVYKQSKKEVYFNVEEGVEFVRTGMYAFHVDQPANQVRKTSLAAEILN